MLEVPHVVLRIRFINDEQNRTTTVCEALKAEPDGTYAWTEKRHEEFGFPTMEEAQAVAKLHGGRAVPQVRSDEKREEVKAYVTRKRERTKAGGSLEDTLKPNPHMGLKIFGYGRDE